MRTHPNLPRALGRVLCVGASVARPGRDSFVVTITATLLARENRTLRITHAVDVVDIHTAQGSSLSGHLEMKTGPRVAADCVVQFSSSLREAATWKSLPCRSRGREICGLSESELRCGEVCLPSGRRMGMIEEV